MLRGSPLDLLWSSQSDHSRPHRVLLTHSPSNEVAPADGSGGAVKVGVDLVLVSVTVTDRRGQLVLGLQKDSFNVFDQGKQKMIRHLSNQDAPISVGIIFDASGSMYGKMERSREAVLQFLRSSNPEDEFFLLALNDRPELLVDFTSSPSVHFCAMLPLAFASAQGFSSFGQRQPRCVEWALRYERRYGFNLTHLKQSSCRRKLAERVGFDNRELCYLSALEEHQPQTILRTTVIAHCIL
jgi:hypothetical protein